MAVVSLTTMMGIDHRALRVAWTVFLFALALTVIWFIRSTIAVFAGAVFFAYMLSPVVGVVERFIKRRRALALTIVYCLLVGLLVLIGFQLVPAVAGQAINLSSRLPGLVSGGNLAKLPLPAWAEPMRNQLVPVLNRVATNLQSSVVPFLQQAGSHLLSGLGATLPIILIPILAFFFLKDARSIRGSILTLVDKSQSRAMLDRILDDIHDVLRNYIRALVLLSIASFCAWAIFLSVLRYPYELLLAGVSAIFEFIPVIGPAAALAILLSVCIVTGTGGLIWIVVFWASFRVFQDYVLNPYLMSSGIEIHPLLVLFGVLAGDALAGVPGMFFSVPVLAILRLIIIRMRTASQRRDPVREAQRVLLTTDLPSDLRPEVKLSNEA
ncbi:MAG: AI-2E family transporter [Bryobacteraceae bacterium]